MPSSEFGEFRLNVITCRGLLERTWLKALAMLSAALNGSSILTIEIDREHLQFCQKFTNRDPTDCARYILGQFIRFFKKIDFNF